MSIHIETNSSSELYVRFDYSADRLKKIKSIPNRRWDSVRKIWIVKNTIEILQQLQDIFSDEEISIDGKNNSLSEVNHQESPALEPNTTKYANLPCFNLFSDYLKLKGYSFKTRKAYAAHIRRLIEFHKKMPQSISEDEIRAYLVYLISEKATSHSYVNQTISAIKLFYQNILKQPELFLYIPRPKKERKLPNVLSEDEVYKILESLRNIKHKAILYIMYSAGLRVGEVVRLKLEDIDGDRMLIHVVQGKGRKDRYTMLSPYTYEKIKIYLDLYKPEVWLFPGGDGKGHITERTVEKVFEQACSKTDISKHATPHTFRHCFGTHALENGYDIRFIQELLGHSDPKTTEIYTHVAQTTIQKLQSPLDKLMSKKK